MYLISLSSLAQLPLSINTFAFGAVKSGNADLSRRFVQHILPYLSFREFPQLKYNLELSILDVFHLNNGSVQEILSRGPILKYFREYLEEGLRPLFFEGSYKDRLQQIVQKTVYDDIPFIIKNVSENHRRLMIAIIGHLASSSVPTLNIDSLCRDWSIGKGKLYEILEALEEVGLIHIVRIERDHKTLSKGAKIFFQDSSIYGLYTKATGNVCEAFCTTMFKSIGKKVYASVNDVDADLKVDKVKIEIGGRSKNKKRADFVVRDDVEVPSGNTIPLWTVGMIY